MDGGDGIGGGGLMSGIGTFVKNININTYIEENILLNNTTFNNKCLVIGAEPSSCPSMRKSLESKSLLTVPIKDTFVDGASVAKVGKIPFDIMLCTFIRTSYHDHIQKFVKIKSSRNPYYFREGSNVFSS